MAQSQTTASRLARIERAIEALVLAQPAVAAPRKASAKQSEFVEFLHERAAAKVGCEIHEASVCTRRFSPKSSGLENHLARLV